MNHIKREHIHSGRMFSSDVCDFIRLKYQNFEQTIWRGKQNLTKELSVGNGKVKHDNEEIY